MGYLGALYMEKRRDEIGDRIRRAREARGLTMSDLARAAGLSAGAVSRIEHGARAPGSATLQRLAQALGLEAGALIDSPAAAPPPAELPAAGVADQTVLETISLIASRMPPIPSAGRARILAVVRALLGDEGGRPAGLT